MTSRIRIAAIYAALGLSLAGCGGSRFGGSRSSGPPLPAGWSGSAIGAVSQPGSGSGAGSSFTLTGSGADIWGTEDAFVYVYRTLSGDGEMTARVVSLDYTDAWAKAGVMIRESLNPNSTFAMTVATPGNGASYQYRLQTGQSAGLSSIVPAVMPYWVRVRRTGSTFSGFGSADGQSWSDLGSVSISMGSDVHIGLCVTAHNNAAMATGVFDSVSYGGGTPPPPPGDSVSVSTPIQRTVYQRNNSNWANVPISGAYSGTVSSVQARALVRVAGQGSSTGWTTIDGAPSGGFFHGSLAVSGGWYSLEVRTLSGGSTAATTAVDRFGVGEVFLISGHSVAQGQDINIAATADDRANTVPVDTDSPSYQSYLQTGDPQYLPWPGFAQYGDGIKPSPFGAGTYFWSKFCGVLAQKLNVPVAIYNAGFGGTSLDMWAKSSQGIWFDHSFVNASIRMPYINVYNVLKKYIPLTGIRAVLCDHGQNDYGQPDSNVILQNYQTWVNQSRADLGFGSLAMVINRQTPFHTYTQVRTAQDQMAQTANCWPGPDYDMLAPEDTVDGIHLSASGEEKAAVMWADALTSGFFSSSTPYVPPF